MSESEAISKINKYKIKLNEVNFKLNKLNELLSENSKKEETCSKLYKNHLSKSITSFSLTLLTALSLYTLPIAIILLIICTFETIKTIKFVKKLRQIKKHSKILNSKKGKLVFAKIVFEANKIKLANECGDIALKSEVKHLSSSLLSECKTLQEQYPDEDIALSSL